MASNTAARRASCALRPDIRSTQAHQQSLRLPRGSAILRRGSLVPDHAGCLRPEAGNRFAHKTPYAIRIIPVHPLRSSTTWLTEWRIGFGTKSHQIGADNPNSNQLNLYAATVYTFKRTSVQVPASCTILEDLLLQTAGGMESLRQGDRHIASTQWARLHPVKRFEMRNCVAELKKGQVSHEQDFIKATSRWYPGLINRLRGEVFPHGRRWETKDDGIYLWIKRILRSSDGPGGIERIIQYRHRVVVIHVQAARSSSIPLRGHRLGPWAASRDVPASP
ncbi:Uncharacterized protein TCAP_07009, partial [Tolypocladium capitatum]